MLTSFFNSGIIGLDIGSSSVKLATLVKKNNGYRLESCDIAFFEKECFNEAGDILDFDYVQNIVNDLVSRQKYKAKKVVLSVPHRSIVQDAISLPNSMAVDEQNYQIEVEA